MLLLLLLLLLSWWDKLWKERRMTTEGILGWL
jgi:predicted component of type VI protein secretion system